MPEPITFRRIRSAVMACGELRGEASNPQQVVRLLKSSADYKSDFQFMNRETGRPKLISDQAITNWLRHASYWGLITNELVTLTPKGLVIYNGNFNNQLHSYLAEYVGAWKRGGQAITIDDIIRELSPLDGKRQDNWPSVDHWYDRVSSQLGVELSKTRFKQLAYFFVGLGLVHRKQYTLYTR